MDWLDFLAVQGTLKSLLQHHSSKASLLLHSAFFIVQLSHPFMTNGKTIALTRQPFVGKAAAAAAAKSLQSCLTLCDPIDGSPPGSTVPGILQARTLEWVAITPKDHLIFSFFSSVSFIFNLLTHFKNRFYLSKEVTRSIQTDRPGRGTKSFS